MTVSRVSRAGQVQGSFRDPDGCVFIASGKVFRGVSSRSSAFLRKFLQSEFYESRAGSTLIVTKEVSSCDVILSGISKSQVDAYDMWVEHERIPLITYPYEWCFESLKQAASLTLTLLFDALQHGYTLKDASAFNVQFINCQPIFIDILSFVEYEQDSPFIGYKQFCEHFLAPLCLTAFTRIEFNSWYRGQLEGLDLVEVSEALPFRAKFNPTVFIHIYLHALAIRKINLNPGFSKTHLSSKSPKPIAKKNLLALVQQLHRSIAKLERRTTSYWQEYEHSNSYDEEATTAKAEILLNFIKRHRIENVLDIGCNTGAYTKLAVDSGARYSVGMDVDCGAVNVAVQEARSSSAPVQFLIYDIANPSPNGGWRNEERICLERRLESIDGLICFALIHHLVIGRNIPIQEFVHWVVSLAPRGLIEFVPKSDPMIKQMLLHRQDVFSDYTQEKFESFLGSASQKMNLFPLPSTCRVIYEYET